MMLLLKSLKALLPSQNTYTNTNSFQVCLSRTTFFVVAEKYIFRKNIRKASVTELCIFPTEFGAS